MEELRRAELTIENLTDDLKRISLVSEPAIESDFFYFSKADGENIERKFAIENEEKRVITGLAMIPNMDILRQDEVTGEYYYVYFSEATIYKCAELFFKSNDSATNQSNVEHKLKVDGVTVFESWIVDNAHGKGGGKNFQDAVDGTWVVSYKIDNEALWNDFVKTGIIKGFSIEGRFTEKFNSMVNNSMVKDDDEKFLSNLKDILDSDKTDEEIIKAVNKLNSLN